MIFNFDGDILTFIIKTFARFGVPFFFMISGFLFVQKLLISPDMKIHFKKYIFKILKLFLYWNLFYVIYGILVIILKAINSGLSIRNEIVVYLNSFFGIKEIIIFLMYGDVGIPASFHLWYLSALIWCILTIYLFLKINQLNLLLILSLFLNLIGLFGQSYSGIFNLEFSNYNIITRDAVFFGLFYTTMGSYIALNFKWVKYKVDNIKSSTLIILFVLFSLTQIVERIIANILWSKEIRAEDFYLSTIFLTISLFLFVIKNGHIGKNSKISKIGKNAVGIYVSHTLIIDITFLALGFLGILIRGSIIFQLIFTPFVFVAAYLFYNVLQIIKFKFKFLFLREKHIKLLE